MLEQDASDPVWSYNDYMEVHKSHYVILSRDIFLPSNLLPPAVPPKASLLPSQKPPPSYTPKTSEKAPVVSPPGPSVPHGSYHSTAPRMVHSTGSYTPVPQDGIAPEKGESQHSTASTKSKKSQNSWRTPNWRAPKDNDESTYTSIPDEAWPDYSVDPSSTFKSNGGGGGDSKASTGSEWKRRHAHKIKDRAKIGDKIVWNGKGSTFKAYSQQIKGHLLQVGAGYLVSEYFLEKYKEEKRHFLYSDDFWTRYQIPIKQAEQDVTYLYGILVSTNHATPNAILIEHAKSMDGVIAWLEFQDTYGNNGSKEGRIEELESELRVKFDPKVYTNFSRYLDSYAVKIQELDSLAPGEYTDQRKKRDFFNSLDHIPALNVFIQYCKAQELTFKETIIHLRKFSRDVDKAIESTTVKIPGQKILNTEVNPEMPPEKIKTILRTAIEKDGIESTYHAFQSSTLRQELRIPEKLWRKIEPNLRKKLMDIKKEIEKEESNRSSSRRKIPDQYPSMTSKKLSSETRSAHLSTMDDTPDDVSVETDNDGLSDILEVRGFMAQKIVQIRANFEIAARLGDNAAKIYAISDGGADACVVGRHARVEHDTGRFAHLIGCDPNTMRTPKVPIVTAYLKVNAHNDIPVFLKINEAAYNEKSPVTLLSEYQVRDHGYIIDSVATRHKAAHDQYGKQRLELNECVHVPFEDRGGMMGFEILEITDSDFLPNGEPAYDVFEITSPDKWDPHAFRKDINTFTSTTASDVPNTIPDDKDDLPALMYRDDDMSVSTANSFEALIDTFEVPDLEIDYEYDMTDDRNAFLQNLTLDELTGLKEVDTEEYDFPSVHDYDPLLDAPQDRLAQLMFTPKNLNNYKEHDEQSPNSNVFTTRHWHRVIHQQMTPRKLQPYLGYRPENVIAKTLQHTTQLARMILRTPLRKHIKARNPFLHVQRLDEAVSTDCTYANCKSLYHGYVGAQVFYGHKSKHIDVYGLKSESEFPDIYRDFIREQGAPSILRRDNAQLERSEKVKEIQREMYIKDEFSEPDNQQQNLVEGGAIKWLKQATHTLLDRTGAPDSTFFLAMKYLAMVHNVCWDKSLDSTPYTVRHGRIKDISALLQFCFWERVLYMDC